MTRTRSVTATSASKALSRLRLVGCSAVQRGAKPSASASCRRRPSFAQHPSRSRQPLVASARQAAPATTCCASAPAPRSCNPGLSPCAFCDCRSTAVLWPGGPTARLTGLLTIRVHVRASAAPILVLRISETHFASCSLASHSSITSLRCISHCQCRRRSSSSFSSTCRLPPSLSSSPPPSEARPTHLSPCSSSPSSFSSSSSPSRRISFRIPLDTLLRTRSILTSSSQRRPLRPPLASHFPTGRPTFRVPRVASILFPTLCCPQPSPSSTGVTRPPPPVSSSAAYIVWSVDALRCPPVLGRLRGDFRPPPPDRSS